MLVPKSVTALRSYTRQQFVSDLTAGIIVGVVAIPLAIAFAIASGVTPDKGLYTAIIAGFLISALGGSRVQIGGPTGAFVVIVYGIVQKYGIDGLTIATLMAGAILVVFGLVRLGSAIKFIPYPVTIGFTAGIALVILSGEVKDFFGLEMGAVPADFLEKLRAYGEHFHTINPYAVGIAALALAIIIVWPKLNRRIPGSFVALIVTTALAQLLHLPLETIGSRFGSISAGLPHPSLPHVDLARLHELIAPAFTIALLGGIESLLSAVVADGMIGGRHRSNMELVAQGVANLVTPIFGGIPATGAIARTATNVRNGGRTPVAGMIHALTLLAVTLFVGKWAALIPMATLAAILVVVSYHMSEWRGFRNELRGAPKSDAAVMLATFLLTVLVDLTIAIEVGMVLAAFLFMKRMAEVTDVSMVTRELNDDTTPDELRGALPKGVVVYEINGPFFFGAAEKFRDTLGQIADPAKVLVIRMRNVKAIDSTALHALKDVVRRTRGDGTRVMIAEAHAQPLMALARSYLLDEIGDENVFGTVDDALAGARRHLGLMPAEPPKVVA